MRGRGVEVDDDGKPRDACGVVGVAANVPAADVILDGLRALQHRGQESAGIATFHGTVSSHKGMGLVDQVFDSDAVHGLKGTSGIGHVRYGTVGGSFLENAQPITVTSSFGDVALGHNGELTNAVELREELHRKGWAFLTTNDSEVAVRILANDLAENGNPVRAIRQMMRAIRGSYSFTILVKDRVFAVRDPLGVKPLVYGRLPDGLGFMAASESVALDILSAKVERDVEPGEILELTPTGVKSYAAPTRDHPAHCMFEYVYFARADSVLDGRGVYDVRVRIGERLAKEQPVHGGSIVVPVPDSGRAHALGFARTSGIPFSEGLMKNRYVHRTFIMPDQGQRDASVRTKLNPVRSIIDGKSVVLVDDSIVRGTTMRRIVRLLRESGAREVHVRVGSPPITNPCYLGIDMHSRKELVASDKSVKEIADFLGADSLGYLSLEGLVEAIGHPRDALCTGCLTGAYPVEIPGEKHRFQKTLF